MFRDFDRTAWLALAFLSLAMLLGGASRADVFSTMIVRLAAIAAAAFCLLNAPSRTSAIKAPEYAMLFLAALMVLQLIPLPPVMWQALPGHGILTKGAEAAGVQNVWRPISMSPDRTLNALFACIPPAAALIVLMRIPLRALRMLILVPLLTFILSGIVGFLQILGGGSGSFYFYKVTNLGSAVGFFSNRNHQALALVLTLPLLAVVPALFSRNEMRAKFVAQLAAIGSAFVIPMVVITGSRTGLILLALAFPVALSMALRGVSKNKTKKAGALVNIAAPSLFILVIGVVIFMASRSKDSGLARLYSHDIAMDPRLSLIPQYIKLILDYFPFGSGFGSFDQVFKIEEPMSYLNFNYLNHAHNDVLEMLIEGGAFSALLLVAGLAWIVRRSWGVWRNNANSPTQLVAKAATVCIALIGLASVTDYPLRTPAISVFLMLCGTLLARWDERELPTALSSGRGRHGSGRGSY